MSAINFEFHLPAAGQRELKITLFSRRHPMRQKVGAIAIIEERRPLVRVIPSSFVIRLPRRSPAKAGHSSF